ncbi:hypothetical protein AVEN_18-1 [Araneus ventricosus]|uniref:Uncharacterized protein n=1 Tax=Araneus ventricosus TaxID=182803 RepID=A0A4Y1ZLP3_ARAVE|nr:hypothetical protein AVEN_18-1 [Araneus ventricosus]
MPDPSMQDLASHGGTLMVLRLASCSIDVSLKGGVSVWAALNGVYFWQMRLLVLLHEVVRSFRILRIPKKVGCFSSRLPELHQVKFSHHIPV